MGSFIMKIKTKSGITEELDFERIVNQLQQMALEKDYYFTELDINYLIKNIKNEKYPISFNNLKSKFLKENLNSNNL